MDFNLEEFLDRQFLENTYRDYAWFIGIILLGLIFKLLISRLLSRMLFVVIRRVSKHGHPADFVRLLSKPLEIFFVLFVLLLAFNQLHYPEEWHLSDTNKFGLKNVVNKLIEVAFILSVTWVILRLIDYFAYVFTQKNLAPEHRAESQVINFGRELSKIIIFIFSVFFILGSVFHVNIASLVAGLGIGGLAIALAAQETLANLLGSFVIFLDKPFEVGDVIKTDKISGTVEQIGFRSTKIRTPDRSLMIVPNKMVASEILNNVTKSTSRRVRILIGLSYETRAEQVKQVMKEIEEAISIHSETYENYSVFFDTLADSSMQIEIVFFTMTNDGDTMQRIRQEMNFRILEIVEKNGAKLAYPSSTVYVKSEVGSQKS